MNQGFWMSKGSGGVNDGGTNYNGSSRMEQKRSHQWFVDGAELDIFPNKKQAIGVNPTTLFSGTLNSNLFGSSSTLQSVSAPFADGLFNSEPARIANFDGRDISSVGPREVYVSQDLGEGPFGIGSSHGLSMSNALEHPIQDLNYGGIRKVKVSQVNESETQMSAKSLEQFYDRRGNMAHVDEDTNHSERLMSYHGRSVDQHPIQNLGQSAGTPASTTPTAVSGAVKPSKKKEEVKVSTKAPPNSFPSNVRSLLATGLLDGVPVKYVASREKELRGVIKGSGYLCGCQTCNFSKVVNGYELERHAGSKTKHPNDHIFFESGKTIYGVVQELRNTPPSMLVNVIQTIFGSPINQKSFNVWKESFLAATRELQRIYGKDEEKPMS